MYRFIQHIIDQLKKLDKRGWALLLAFIGLSALAVKRYIVTSILVAATAVTVWAVHKMGLRSTGIELTTFTTVILGYTFGPWVGFFAGLALIFFQVIVGKYSGIYLLWVVPSYGFAGALAGLLAGQQIFFVGMGITVALHAVFLFFTRLFNPGNMYRYLVYASTNLLFNLVIFMFLAEALLPLLA